LEESINKFQKAGQEIYFKSDINELFAPSNSQDLETVFMHVIQNALDANQGDKPVNVHLSLERDYAVITIEDFGSGMAPDFIKNELFRPFRSLKKGGYGIGAYESRQLIHNMNGRIEVKSREGFGTSVIIYLKRDI